MQSILKAVEISDKEEDRWNRLLAEDINSSYRQNMSYQYSKTYNNRNISTFIFIKDDLDFAGAHYSIKKLEKFGIIVADAQSGFLFKNYPDKKTYDTITNHFINWAKNKNAAYIRLFPWLPNTINKNTTPISNWLKPLIKNKGFKAIVPGRFTYWINLEKSEEEILQNMKRKTRYRINRAKKSVLQIIRYDKPSNELFEIFWDLYQYLGSKKGFDILMKKSMEKEFFSLMNSNHASLFVAKCQKVVVNVSFLSTKGIATNMYGAMNPKFKSISDCSSPGQLVQWEMIKYLKSINNKTYDMGFCPGPVPIENSPYYNIWNFKFGFGGDTIQYLPIYGKKLKPLKGLLFQLLKYKKLF